MGDMNTLWIFEGDSSEAVASLEEIGASLDGLEEAVSQAAASAAELDTLGESLANAATGGGALTESIGGVDDALASLQEQADAASAQLGALAASADATGGELDALGGQADTTGGQLDAMGGQADAASAQVDTAGESTSLFSSKLSMLKMPLLIAGAAIVAAGVASVVMAGKFQESMTQLVTGAGESQKNLQLVSNGILNMAGQVGESTGQLASGMYMIESAGYHGSAALTILKDAAEGAKVGASDLGTVADATTTILNDFGSKGVTASNAVNALIATVANGKTHMQDLAQSLSQILPTASAANVGLNDVMGAMATMTGEAVPAANAATYLRQTILALDAPSAAAEKSLNSVGLTTQQVSTEMQKSLPDTIQMITEAVGKKFPVGSAAYVNALKNIAGGSKTMQGLLDLSGSHLATFKQNVDNVTTAVQKGGGSIAGWGATSADFNTKMAQLGATIEVAAIKIGGQFLPAIAQIAGVLSAHLPAAIAGVITVISFLGAHMQIVGPIALVLAGVIGGALVFALYSFATAAWAALVPVLIAAAPFIAVGAAIAVVGIAIYELVTHWKQVAAFFEDIWHVITTFVGNVVGAVVGFASRVGATIQTTVQGWEHRFQSGVAAIQSGLRAGFQMMVTIIEAPIRAVVALFAWLFNHNYYFHDLVVGIQREMEMARTIITAIWNGIKAFLSAAWNLIKSAAEGDWLLIKMFIIHPIQEAVSTIEAAIHSAQATLLSVWNTITSDTQNAWNKFVAIIQAAVGLATSAVNNVTQAILSPIENLAGTLFSAGQHLIQMLINGISSMAGQLESEAGNIAHSISSMLGFHSPTEKGPGATADQWMPALGAMLERDLNAQAARVGAAAQHVAQALASGLRVSGVGAPGVGGAGGGGIGGPILSGVGASSLGGGGGLGVGGGAQAQLLASILHELQSGGMAGNRAAPLGSAPIGAGLGSVTQNFGGGINLHGVTDINSLFQQLTQLAGLAQEYGMRGATVGLGI